MWISYRFPSYAASIACPVALLFVSAAVSQFGQLDGDKNY
jgi:hypothetical protein